MKFTYKHTLFSCYICFFIQGLVNNFSPLLFATYSREFGVTLDQMAFLVVFNFAAQMVVDLLGVKFSSKINKRAGMIAAHITSFVGIAGLALLPMIMPPFAGLVIASMFCAFGSGFIEVLVSPIVEALPNDETSAAISLLHSFYCWGHIGIVLVSTLFFALAGMENWRILTLLWALVPVINGIIFVFVPLVPSAADGDAGLSLRDMWKLADFRLLLLLMLCGGAQEQVLAQWSSLFAETGLGVDKVIGDLLGPCLFGLMMALARVYYGARGGRLDLRRFMTISAVGMFGGYMLTVFAPHPILSLVGCGLCGFFAGIFWPGTLSLASRAMPLGGTTMFASLAFAGDVGCALGPGLAGYAADLIGENGLRGGILLTSFFPVISFITLILLAGSKKKGK